MATHFLTKHQALFDYYQESGIEFNKMSIEEAIDILRQHKTLDFDTETNGLNPRQNRILLMQFGTPEDQYVIDARDYSPELFKPLFDTNIVYRGHNLVFDYNMLKQYGIRIRRGYCTMVADMVLHCGKYEKGYIIENSRFSMAGVYYHYFGEILEKEVRLEFLTWGDQPFRPDQIEYSANDVISTRKIAGEQVKLIEEWEMGKVIDLEMKAQFALGDISYNGMLLDKTKWRRLAEENEVKLAQFKDDLDNEILKRKHPTIDKYRMNQWTPDLFDPEWKPRQCTLNWGSPKQVLDVFVNVYKCEPRTNDGKLSTAEKVLERLKKKPKIVKMLLNFREFRKALDTYGEKFIKSFVQDDGRVHTTFNQVVDTGRVSSRNPNMQNIKKESDYRSCFVAPPGYKIICADYSAQEPRTTANYAKDPALIEFFKTGHGDIHSWVTSMLYTKLEGRRIEIPPKIDGDEQALKIHYSHPYAKFRFIGKQLGLKLDYGGTAYTLQFLLNCSQKEAQKFIDVYFAAFPGKKKFFDKTKRFGLKNGYVLIDPVVRRRSWLREHEEWLAFENTEEKLTRDEYRAKMKLQGDMERKCMNYPIQGTCGSMTKLALVLIKEEIERRELDAMLVNVVHDEVEVEAHEDDAEEVAGLIQDCMGEAGKVFCQNIDMKAVPSVSTHWNH